MPELPPPNNFTVDAINSVLISRARGGDSAGVPMSDAVNPCDRAIWYSVHWSSPPEAPSGPQQSRFRTGEFWETRLLDDLEAIGCEVQRLDPETGKQFIAILADGHLRGKLDGIAKGVPEAPTALHVVECKSHNDKNFKALTKSGVAIAKPEHNAQCQLYMSATGIARCLYLAVNKNTDERYAERLAYDPVLAATIEARVLRIVGLSEPPPRLHDDPTSKAAFACAWCKHKAVCHEAAFARVNCRTCLRSTVGIPWVCDLHKAGLTWDVAQIGCDAHRYIPSLVPGEQVDVDGDLVVYRMPDGATWVDGERAPT